MRFLSFISLLVIVFIVAGCSNLNQYLFAQKVNTRSSNGLLLPVEDMGMILVYTNDEDIESEVLINSKLVGNIKMSNVLYVNLVPGEYVVSTPFSDTFSQNIAVGMGEIISLNIVKEKGSFYIKPVLISDLETVISQRNVVVSNF